MLTVSFSEPPLPEAESVAAGCLDGAAAAAFPCLSFAVSERALAILLTFSGAASSGDALRERAVAAAASGNAAVRSEIARAAGVAHSHAGPSTPFAGLADAYDAMMTSM